MEVFWFLFAKPQLAIIFIKKNKKQKFLQKIQIENLFGLVDPNSDMRVYIK
jgi:hypothetical protein